MAATKTRKPSPPRASKKSASTMGSPEQKSRAKADSSAKRAQATNTDPDGVPRTADGRPMAKISMSAAELLPTGQFANVSVGPVVVTVWIDPQDEDPIPEEEYNNIAAACNKLGELTEVDVVGVQRNLVLESIQQQVKEAAEGNGK